MSHTSSKSPILPVESKSRKKKKKSRRKSLNSHKISPAAPEEPSLLSPPKPAARSLTSIQRARKALSIGREESPQANSSRKKKRGKRGGKWSKRKTQAIAFGGELAFAASTVDANAGKEDIQSAKENISYSKKKHDARQLAIQMQQKGTYKHVHLHPAASLPGVLEENGFQVSPTAIKGVEGDWPQSNVDDGDNLATSPHSRKHKKKRRHKEKHKQKARANNYSGSMQKTEEQEGDGKVGLLPPRSPTSEIAPFGD